MSLRLRRRSCRLGHVSAVEDARESPPEASVAVLPSFRSSGPRPSRATSAAVRLHHGGEAATRSAMILSVEVNEKKLPQLYQRWHITTKCVRFIT
jgi:hypothetical protein